MNNLTNNISIIKNQNIKVINNDLYSQFIQYLDTSQKTVETYSKALKQFFKYMNVNGIKAPQRNDILTYKEYLKATNKKPTTIQNYLTAVKIFFNWTEQQGLYPNIAVHIKGAKIDREHKKDYLTSSQVKEILNNINTDTVQGARDYAILTLMITGGLRTIEVIRANIEDMRTIGEYTVLYVQGKGKEEKTDYIKISSKVEKSIRQYLKMRGKISNNAPLFAGLSNNNKSNRMTTRAISGIVKKYLVKAGYNSERLTAHSLRHTAVTLSLMAGKDITEVQQFARHANITTTMIYNHSLEKAKNGCSEAIANTIF